jgi:predicted nucleic acid-binding protein
MNAIDTNIWVYCHDARDGEKQRVAQELIETAESIVLLWQVGCEFIAAARKLHPFGFTFARLRSGAEASRCRDGVPCL